MLHLPEINIVRDLITHPKIDFYGTVIVVKSLYPISLFVFRN